MSVPWECIVFGINCPPVPVETTGGVVVGPNTWPNPDDVSERLRAYVKQLDASGREPTVGELRELQKMLTEEGLPASALIVANLLQPRLTEAGAEMDLGALFRQQAYLHRAVADDLIRQAERQADQQIGSGG